jgi:hypothetical protein
MLLKILELSQLRIYGRSNLRPEKWIINANMPPYVVLSLKLYVGQEVNISGGTSTVLI